MPSKPTSNQPFYKEQGPRRLRLTQWGGRLFNVCPGTLITGLHQPNVLSAAGRPWKLGAGTGEPSRLTT